jgi:hypothetical protein
VGIARRGRRGGRECVRHGALEGYDLEASGLDLNLLIQRQLLSDQGTSGAGNFWESNNIIMDDLFAYFSHFFLRYVQKCFISK